MKKKPIQVLIDTGCTKSIAHSQCVEEWGKKALLMEITYTTACGTHTSHSLPSSQSDFSGGGGEKS